jgi:hypothetical protein
MARAHELVRSCVGAGYAKIHLDASMRCADDRGDASTALDADVIVERTVALCRTAEAARAELPAALPAPLYVIGTEVPTPGGEEAGQAGPSVTPVADVERTLDLTCEAFRSAGLAAAWERVIAVVVQPGVEFGDATVSAYDRAAASGLTALVERRPRLVYEAHSTDYQSAEALQRLVEDHFAILKVGPWLTFAFREAVFALEKIERQVLRGLPGAQPSRLRDALDEAMTRHPEHWAAYYRGSPEEVRRKRAFSYSDRCRYCWPQPEVQEALAGLLRNLSEAPSRCRSSASSCPRALEPFRKVVWQPSPWPWSATISSACSTCTRPPATTTSMRQADAARRGDASAPQPRRGSRRCASTLKSHEAGRVSVPASRGVSSARLAISPHTRRQPQGDPSEERESRRPCTSPTRPTEGADWRAASRRDMRGTPGPRTRAQTPAARQPARRSWCST